MAAVQHCNGAEARKVFVEGLERAVEAGRWMAAAWEVRDGMLTMVQCTTWDFPTGDFDKALEQMKAFCDEEKQGDGRVVPTVPLPKAQLFGRGSAEKPPPPSNIDTREGLVPKKPVAPTNSPKRMS